MTGSRLRRLFVVLLVVAMAIGLPAPAMQGAAMAAAGCADCDAGPGDDACAPGCTAIPAIGDAAYGLQWIGPASFGTRVGDDESGLAPGPDPSPPRNLPAS